MSTAPTITDADLKPIRDGIADPLLGPSTLTPGRVVGRILARMDAAEEALREVQLRSEHFSHDHYWCGLCGERTPGHNPRYGSLQHDRDCPLARFNPKTIEATA